VQRQNIAHVQRHQPVVLIDHQQPRVEVWQMEQQLAQRRVRLTT